MLLERKNAIIYGAGGGIGGGVARTFAREGAQVWLAGRTRTSLEAAASDIAAAGGTAEVAEVDALDERSVDEHVAAGASQGGSVDVSFNLISRGDIQGIPIVDIAASDFAGAVTNGVLSQFLTARAAARRMTEQGSGVILAVTSASAAGNVATPGMGNTGPIDAAIESFMRYLATEVGPQGVRVVGLWTAGVAETLTPEKLAEVNPTMDASAVDAILEGLAGATMLQRNIVLADVTETAAFLASDRASGITGTIVNVTRGMVAGG